jgi:hypothetical protein
MAPQQGSFFPGKMFVVNQPDTLLHNVLITQFSYINVNGNKQFQDGTIGMFHTQAVSKILNNQSSMSLLLYLLYMGSYTLYILYLCMLFNITRLIAVY